MIIVYCKFGGEGLLGKAREIADSTGDRILALTEKESIDPQKLIRLGADEVLQADVDSPSEWVLIISDLVQKDKIRAVLFPSNIVSNIIAGAIYSRVREKTEIFLEEVDFLDVSTASKSFDGLGLSRNFGEKLSIISMKTTSVPPPYEDSSRYGKVRELAKDSAPLSFLLEEASEQPLSSSGELTVILGNDKLAEPAKKFAEKYGAVFLKYSSTVEVVYGPCVAIELDAKLRTLPEFKGNLISLNSKPMPIDAISDVVVVNPEIAKILESMK